MLRVSITDLSLFIVSKFLNNCGYSGSVFKSQTQFLQAVLKSHVKIKAICFQIT